MNNTVNNDINLHDISNGKVVNGKWKGRGIFDKLISAVNENIEMHYEANRITSEDFSKVYVSSIDSVLRESVNFLIQKKVTEKNLQEKDIDIKIKDQTLQNSEEKWVIEKQLLETELQFKDDLYQAELDLAAARIAKNNKDIEKADKEIAALDSQKLLYDRQIQGFDENKLQKLFESQIDAWSLVYSSGIYSGVPTIFTDDAVSDLYNNIYPQTTPPAP